MTELLEAAGYIDYIQSVESSNENIGIEVAGTRLLHLKWLWAYEIHFKRGYHNTTL